MEGELGGFRAQRLSLDHSVDPTGVLAIQLRTSSGSFVAPLDCLASIFLWGGGGSGEVAAGYRAGGGASALYKSFPLVRGARVEFEIGLGGPSQGTAGQPGNHGQASILRIPGGATLIAGGGGGGGKNSQIGRGGVASGGDINRAGQSGSTTIGQGGSAASFSDYSDLAIFAGGAGATYPGATGGSPGGGSNSTDGTNPSGPGGRGQLIYVLHQIR